MNATTDGHTDVESEKSLRGEIHGDCAWVIVSQVKSNRVVYFTDDPDYQPTMEGDWYYVSIHRGGLPKAMTLRNCWGWRYNGGVFRDAREPHKTSAAESLLEHNRKALLRILCEKIDAVRKPFLASCVQGDVLRKAKLKDALAYLSVESGQGEAVSRVLEAVAVARNCSVIDAARIIVAKAEENERVLIESERFREQMNQAIRAASNEAVLSELRQWLLDKIYPELSEQFKYRIENTQPIDLDAVISEMHRQHEIARLKAQLREAINRKREPLRSEYLGNDEIRRHKAMLAQSLLENDGVPCAGVDYSLLEMYAAARGVPLMEAARLIAESLAGGRELLMRTENIKDLVLARIDALRTLQDIRKISETIKEIGA